jgi:hypothetical protein
MQVSTDIRRWDLLVFNLYMLPRIKHNWIVCAAFLLLTFCVLLIADHLTGNASNIPALVVISVLFTTVGLTVATLFCLAIGLLLAGEKSGNLGSHVISLRKDGLHESTAVNEGLHRWKGISSLLKSKDYLYVGINWYMFHIIPARAFASRGEFERFTTLTRELRAAAQESP